MRDGRNGLTNVFILLKATSGEQWVSCCVTEFSFLCYRGILLENHEILQSTLTFFPLSLSSFRFPFSIIQSTSNVYYKYPEFIFQIIAVYNQSLFMYTYNTVTKVHSLQYKVNDSSRNLKPWGKMVFVRDSAKMDKEN